MLAGLLCVSIPAFPVALPGPASPETPAGTEQTTKAARKQRNLQSCGKCSVQILPGVVRASLRIQARVPRGFVSSAPLQPALEGAEPCLG